MKQTVNNVDIVVEHDEFPIDPIEYSERFVCNVSQTLQLG
jgi:hypothetical protein